MSADHVPTGRYSLVGHIYPGTAPETGVTLYACEDCGGVVHRVRYVGSTRDGRQPHDRFHAILNDHAKAIAVLVNSHLAEHVHDRFDVRERIGKSGNNWSGEALAEVVADLEATEANASSDAS